MGKITDYWLEQLKPVTDLSQVRDLSGVTKNLFSTEEKILNPEIDDFFYSCGYDSSIMRFKQAKESYGLECNASTVMYLLQSYRLVPNNMSRKEFEHAFTPLTPPEFSKGDFIHIGGKKQDLRPVDLFSDILGKDIVNVGLGNVTRAENILRGANNLVSPLTPNGNAVNTLNKIVDAFVNIRGKGYVFGSLMPIVKNKSNFKSLYRNLEKAGLQESYFKKGGGVFTGVSLLYESLSLGHYVLIVKDAISFLEKNGKRYYIFPADDSWHGKVYVLVPNPLADGISINYWTNTYKNITENSGTLYYKNQLLFTISASFALGQ